MGFDSSTKSDIDSSSVLNAEHVNDTVDAINNFVNKGINTAELKNAQPYSVDSENSFEKEGWVTSKLIYRPEFYGAPSPRMTAVSGQAYYRQQGNSWPEGAVFNADAAGSDYVGVPGACATIKLRHNAMVNIQCSFYMFEFGGINTQDNNTYLGRHLRPHYTAWSDDYTFSESKVSRNGDNSVEGYESYPAGFTRLTINGEHGRSTLRRIYTSNVEPRRSFARNWRTWGKWKYAQKGFLIFNMLGRHLHTFTYQIYLPEGTHSIGLSFKSTSGGDFRIQNFAEQQYVGNEYWRTTGDEHTVRRYHMERDTIPTLPNVKNVFFLSRNLVIDAYYTNNNPI